MKIKSQKYFGEAMLLLVTLLWGATFVIVKESLNDISSLLFIGIRFSIAGLFLLPVILKIRGRMNKESVIAGVILGLLNFFAFASQTIGLKYTSATKSGFITGSLVVMIPIFQTIIEKRKPTKGATIGIILVFIGLLFLSSGGSSIFTFLNELGAGFNFGDTLTLLCAVLFAIYVVYLDMVSFKHDYWVLLTVQIYTTAIMGILFSFLFSGIGFEEVKIEITEYLIFGLLYTGILATLVTTALMTKYQKVVSPSKAGIIYSFEPIFAAIFAFVFLAEYLTGLGYMGTILIFSGLLVSELYDRFFK